jgi:hypothetical protein
MPMELSQRGRRLGGLAFLAACVLAFHFYEVPAAAEDDTDDPVVFAMSVESPDGRIIASPVVVGSAGGKLEVRLVCEEDPRRERMSLVLDPVAETDGAVRYSYELSVAGRFESERGTIELASGRERRIEVRPADAKGVTLQLYSAPINHPGLERYLKARRLRLAAAAS